MRSEYISLTILSLLFILAWIPASIGKLKSYGPRWVGSNRKPVTDKELLPWAARCERAHNNLKEFFPAYIVAIVLLGAVSKFDDGTSLAAGLYVFARIGHFVSYGLGNVPMRAAFFAVGLISNIYLLIKILI